MPNLLTWSECGRAARRELWLLATALLFALPVCSGCDSGSGDGRGSRASDLSGTINIDGSSTVAPIMMAAAELFREEHPRVQITVGISGSGGGFKKFLDPSPDLRTDINDASRPIDSSEIARAKQGGIEFIELPIAMDGIAVVVNPGNTFCDSLTVEELRRIWEPGSAITNWKQIRSGFPDLALTLYGPGTDSGTFDYFVETVVGRKRASRSDYMASENDNVLVQGVAGDRGALGYFGFSYYGANREKLKLLATDNGEGPPVTPSVDTIRSGVYQPLSRPLFLYVNKQSAQQPEVQVFLEFFFDHARDIVEHPRVNYVVLSDELYAAVRRRLADGVTGSAFDAAAASSEVGLSERFGVNK